MGTFQIVHHMAADDGRGVPNSLEAIQSCLDQDAAWIEIDVTALADADYLLVHDPDLGSETTGSGPVAACNAERAAGLFFRHAGVTTACRVPRLSEVVGAMVRHGGASRLQVDFKNVFPFPNDEPLRRLVRILEPLGSRVLVSSNADWQLRRLRALAPWLELGLDVHFYIDWRGEGDVANPNLIPRVRGAYGYWDDHPIARQRFWPTAEYLEDRCGALLGLVPGATTFYVSHDLLCQSLDDGFNWAAYLHRAGIRLDAWTLDLDNPVALVNARRLLAAGVDQFTTNTPTALAVSLKEAF